MTALDPSAPAPAVAPTAPQGAAPGTRGRAVTAVLRAGLLLAFAGTCAVRGLPTDRVVLLGWVLAGLAVTSLAHGWRRFVRLLADWLPLVAVLLACGLAAPDAPGLAPVGGGAGALVLEFPKTQDFHNNSADFLWNSIDFRGNRCLCFHPEFCNRALH